MTAKIPEIRVIDLLKIGGDFGSRRDFLNYLAVIYPNGFKVIK